MRLTSCLALLCLAAGCAAPAKPETVWIGHLVPLSGPRREAGEEAVRAIEAALVKAREAGKLTINGRPVGVRHVDSAKGGARAEATRLLAINRAWALLVGPGVEGIEDVVAAARAHDAPVVVLDEVSSRPDGAVLLGSDPARRGEELAKAVAGMKLKRIAALVDASKPANVRLTEAFAQAWADRGEFRQWDSKAKLSDIVAWKPDALLLPAREPGLPAVPLLYSGEDVGPVTGMTTATAFPKGTDRDAALAADGINLLLLALHDAKPFQRDKLREALDAIGDFDSATGPLTWRRHVPVRELSVVGPEAK